MSRYHYPHYNLGRVYTAKELYGKARYHFEEAHETLSRITRWRKMALAKVRHKTSIVNSIVSADDPSPPISERVPP
jgi:hypothetical protein